MNAVSWAEAIVRDEWRRARAEYEAWAREHRVPSKPDYLLESAAAGWHALD